MIVVKDSGLLADSIWQSYHNENLNFKILAGRIKQNGHVSDSRINT